MKRLVIGSVVVNLSMAFRAESDQIVLGIMPSLAAKLFVVNFEIRHRATRLASPAITAEDFVPKLFVPFGIQPQTWALWAAIHEDFSVT